MRILLKKFKSKKQGIILAKINLKSSLLFLHIPLFEVNIYFEFQVYVFSNGRDMTKCHSFCTTTTPSL